LGINLSRREQFTRKLEFIIEKVSHLPDNVEEDEFRQDALYYRLQIAIDAALDVVAMLCKDLGITVKDDYTNLENLQKEEIFTPEMTQQLRGLNGLRNILVHHYNNVELDLVLQQKGDMVKQLTDFTQCVEAVLNERMYPTK
jgi:uncharacterized protein YutE (UPF0331/DUF86 family)